MYIVTSTCTLQLPDDYYTSDPKIPQSTPPDQLGAALNPHTLHTTPPHLHSSDESQAHTELDDVQAKDLRTELADDYVSAC